MEAGARQENDRSDAHALDTMLEVRRRSPHAQEKIQSHLNVAKGGTVRRDHFVLCLQLFVQSALALIPTPLGGR